MWYYFFQPRISPDMNEGVYEIMKEMQGADTKIHMRMQDHAVFFNTQLIDAGDIIVGLSKCVAYGAAIPIVSGHVVFTRPAPQPKW